MNPRILAPTPEAIAQAAQALRDGSLIAFPTETVYGLGGDASNAAAVRRVFATKGRPADHPVIVHVASADDVVHWVREFPAPAWALARAFWPGPLTLVLPRAAHVSDLVTGGQDTVGIRVPSHPIAQALLRAFGGGVAAPSANRFGRISPTTAQHVADDLGDAVALILDGGACDVGIESTIVAFPNGEPMLLRPGGVGEAALARVLGRNPDGASASAPRASGTLPSHYAPHTPSALIEPELLRAEVALWVERDERVAVLARSITDDDSQAARWLMAPADAQGYAHDLYANLRALDAVGADVIAIEAVPQDREWLAVRDRLLRATRGEEDDRD